MVRLTLASEVAELHWLWDARNHVGTGCIPTVGRIEALVGDHKMADQSIRCHIRAAGTVRHPWRVRSKTSPLFNRGPKSMPSKKDEGRTDAKAK